MNIFIGDSHTCGYNESATHWHDNNYAKKYAETTGEKSIIYATPGANHDSYANWLKFLLDKYNNINNAFICLRGFNRFTIAGAKNSYNGEVLPVNHFTLEEISNDINDCYMDYITAGDYFQLYQKTIPSDYDNYVDIKWHPTTGLVSPDLRKNTYMEIKTFLEMNTHLETQNFLKNLFIWDNLCRIKNVTLHVFTLMNNIKIPKEHNHYGELTNTKISYTSVESFFTKKNIDHKRYFLSDNEHYNEEYHTLIAEKYIGSIL